MRKWIPVLIVLAAVAASVLVYSRLTDVITIHWDLQGNPNGWTSRLTGAFALPLAMVGIYAAMRFLPMIDPRRENYSKFEGAYEGIIVTLLVFLLCIHLIVLYAGTGHPVPMQKVMPISMGALFIAIGNLLPRARSNFFFGIRTPWTLSSERSWERTHRVGGYVFVVMGLIVGGAGLVSSSVAFPYVILVAAFALLGLLVYSYLVWRDAPDRKPATFITKR